MMSAPAPYPTVQLSAPAPDDHQITSRTPSICVDYLSHNWTDEDVWSSWKAMTKRKNEIANGVRLENASWRTWAKQRGKLKTISPETLNWLKDSDVTWLYGPLHEHAEPVPPPKVASTQDRLDLDDSVRTKSILKHRTISEMLTTPGRSASPTIDLMGSSAENSREGSDTEGEGVRGGRPSFFAVKSDSNLAARKRKAGGSPPASERLFQNLIAGEKDDGLPHQAPEERRHISFNQRVDQCIAVDVPEDDEDNYSDGMYDSGKREDGEDEEDTPSSDEEVLTMKSSPRTSTAWPLTATTSSQGSSPSLEHQTIAKLAPTMLKTSDVYPAPSPQVVDPTGFTERLGEHHGAHSTEGGSQPTVSSQPQMYHYGASQDEEGLSQTRYSQWDADDDFNGDFDYFNGPDMSDNYQQTHPIEAANVPKDEVASKVGAKPPISSPTLDTGASEQATAGEVSSAPRSILKKRNTAVVSSDETGRSDEAPEVTSPSLRSGADSFAAAPGEEASSPSSPLGEGRGRPAQRIGSASYERLQDASRGSHGSPVAGGGAAGGSLRTRSNSNNSGVSSSPGSSLEGTSHSATVNAPSSSSSSGDPYSNTYGHKPSERRDSFRGRAGDGSKAMGPQSGSYAAVAGAGSAASKKGQSSSSAAIDSDSDGRGSFDFHSPGYPASPLLGDKSDQVESSESNEAKLYGRKKDSSKWADGARNKRKGVNRGAQDDEEEEKPARLSVDLDNLPSNTSPNHSAQGGPTPLNTPTFALAKSRAQRQAKSAHDSASSTAASSTKGKGPDSPTMPRRSSATGALVAPSDADKDAGVRVPLAHDYVEEDEGGIVGRAVEIVNTARDLIGALLGTGGDRGRSWRESY